MSIEEVIDFLKSKKKLYSQMDESGRKDYVMECLDTAIILLSNMADGDLISRTDLLNAIWQKEYGTDYDGVNLLNIKHIDIIEQMPSANKTAECEISNIYDILTEHTALLNDIKMMMPKTAEWKIVGKTTLHYECSKCGGAGDKWDKFCKHCGAKMKGEEE